MATKTIRVLLEIRSVDFPSASSKKNRSEKTSGALGVSRGRLCFPRKPLRHGPNGSPTEGQSFGNLGRVGEGMRGLVLFQWHFL